MLNPLETELLRRYLEGDANSLETEWIENLFAKRGQDPELQRLVLESWNAMPDNAEIPMDPLLPRVHNIIRLQQLEKRESIKNRFIYFYSRIAAVLLIPVLFALLWLNFFQKPATDVMVENGVTSTILAPLGSRVEFKLPDGTTGFLNSGSSLSYSTPFTSARKVKLEGEAWFDVYKDIHHPFSIEMGKSWVNVLGTSFNVSAYQDEKIIEVVLAEGSVEFSPNPSTPAVVLKPSERLVFNGEKITIEKTDPAKFRGWTGGKLIFRGDNMAEVARRLERWYNIEVEIADKALDGYIFRATFEDDSLQEVLRLLSMTSPIRYKVTPRQALDDGTWEKEKVTLYKRN
jgi:ferric-dicitrate binding protein FerR (iron transport regulator)